MFDYFKKALPLKMKKLFLSCLPTTMNDAAIKAQTYMNIAENEKEVSFSSEFSSINIKDNDTINGSHDHNGRDRHNYCGERHDYRDCHELKHDMKHGRLCRTQGRASLRGRKLNKPWNRSWNGHVAHTCMCPDNNNMQTMRTQTDIHMSSCAHAYQGMDKDFQ